MDTELRTDRITEELHFLSCVRALLDATKKIPGEKLKVGLLEDVSSGGPPAQDRVIAGKLKFNNYLKIIHCQE